MPIKTKKQTKSKKTGVGKKSETSNKRMAKKPGRKRPALKTKAIARKTIDAKRKSRPKKKAKTKNNVDTVAFSLKKPGVRSGRQSGDLQGLSDLQGADSESVAELLEEGNPFEAAVVSGVEAADSDEKEVRTHEVPEDDVPDEYLDKD
jgi:hypothetical protein